MSRRDLLDEYFASGAGVCPFARACTRHYVEVGSTPRWSRRELVRVVKEFSETGGATPPHVMILVGSEMTDHEATKAWAIEAYLELNLACSMAADQWSLAELEHEIYVNTRRQLVEMPGDLRPHIALGDSSVITVCMSPVYPVEHPRYAPAAMLLSTWHMDIFRTQTSDVTKKIRSAAHRAHGKKYDADELMLALPETRKR